MVKKVLVVEDELSIVTLLQYNLQQAGYEVVTANDGEEALQKVATEQPNIVLLDIMIPNLDGMEVCKNLRLHRNTVPIIMLTAKEDELDKILGLELGADDYITKPFSPREVVARVKAVLRRADASENANQSNVETSEKKYEFGRLKLFPDRFELRVDDEVKELTTKEFELLNYFMKNKNRVLTREQLLNAIWNYDFAGDTRIVDVHVSHLREKIEENSKTPHFIKTVRGVGYKFEEHSKI